MTSGWRPSGIPSDDVTGHLQPVMFNIEKNLICLKDRLEAEIEVSNILFVAISVFARKNVVLWGLQKKKKFDIF